MKRIFGFARLWILLLPLLIGFTGAASNQLVLAANHDKFPVMVNERKLREFEDRDAKAENVIQALGNLVGVNIVPPKQDIDDDMLDDVHCVMSEKTHLNFLADWIDMHTAMMSPGDMLIDFGGFLQEYAFVFWLAFVLNDYSKTSTYFDSRR